MPQTGLTYDGAGHLSTITDPAGRRYTLTWVGNHITGLADTAGRKVSYTYDGSGNLTDVIDAGSGHSQYGYNAGHLMTTMRSPKNYGGPAGAVTAMAYDSADRVTSQTDAAGDATTFGYPAAGQTLVTDPSGHKTLDTYQNGLLVSETKGYGTADAGTSSYTYDPVTLGVSTTTDADGNARTFTYDDHGNKTSESDPLGFTTNYVYDDNDNLVETIDANGVATVTTYDSTTAVPTSTTLTKANNVVESTTGNFGTAPTRTVKSFYDDAAHPADLSRSVDANGKTTTVTYDSFGDQSTATDPLGDKTQFGYNTGTGWLTSTIDPNGKTTSYDLDAFGQLLKTTDPLGHTTSATYDADHQRTSTTDANNRTTTTTFDAADRAVTVTQADNTAQTTDYNRDGTIADTKDALGDKTSYGYDGQGRQVSRTDPGNRVTSRRLDPAGLGLTATDATGRVTTKGYDATGQLISVSYSDGSTPGVSYDYDPAGQRVSMTDGTGKSTWTYNAFGEITAQTQGSGAAVGYGHDNVGDLTSVAYPGQTTPVTRTFDDAQRLTKVTDWNGNATGFGYNADGQVTTVAYPNGVTVTNTYNAADQLTATAAGTVLSLGYGRDGVGQVSSLTADGATTAVNYSPREQLAGAKGVTFGHDAANSPTTVGSLTQSFDAAGQLTADTFDGSGNRVKAGAATFNYDQAARLTSYTGAGGSATYTYNGDGLRATKTLAGRTTTFVWDAESTPNVLSDGDRQFVYGPGGLPIEQLGTAGTSWFVHDQVGSTAGLLDSTGKLVGRTTYTPYGAASTTGTVTTPLQFTGQYTDAESGLVYLRARYYDPASALFLTPDPMVDKTRTPYAYAGGNPVNYTDPTGLCGFWECLGIGAAVAGAALGIGACIVLEPCGAVATVALVGGGTAIAIDGGVLVGAGLVGSAVAVGGVAIAHTTAGNGGSTAPRDVHGQVQSGSRQIDVNHVWQNGDLYFDANSGNMIRVLDTGDGNVDVVIRDPANPTGRPITSFHSTAKYVLKQLACGSWE